MAQTDELLTVTQAADRLGVSVGWMHQLRAAHTGPLSWKENGRLVYPASGIDLWRAQERQRTTRGAGVAGA